MEQIQKDFIQWLDQFAQHYSLYFEPGSLKKVFEFEKQMAIKQSSQTGNLNPKKYNMYWWNELHT
jgi:hypothetical protein